MRYRPLGAAGSFVLNLSSTSENHLTLLSRRFDLLVVEPKSCAGFFYSGPPIPVRIIVFEICFRILHLKFSADPGTQCAMLLVKCCVKKIGRVDLHFEREREASFETSEQLVTFQATCSLQLNIWSTTLEVRFLMEQILPHFSRLRHFGLVQLSVKLKD